MEFSVQHSGNYFSLTVTGAIDPDTIIEMIDSLLSHEAWKPGMPVLVDESAMDASDITVASIKKIADACIIRKEKFGHAKIAILISRDLEYGLNRMWVAFVDGRWNANCNVFRSQKDAENWIFT